jgi:hypothetical protein
VPVYGFRGARASSPLLKQVRHLRSQELAMHLHNRHLAGLVTNFITIAVRISHDYVYTGFSTHCSLWG